MSTRDPADLSTLELENELATLAAHIQAATARLLALVAEVDRRESWGASGALSCAHWLAFRTGLDIGAAREHVRVARALTTLPKITAAFSRGELSYSKVRAVTRIARPETEADLLAMAREGSTAQVERLVRAYRRADPAAEQSRAAAQAETRWLCTRWAEDGMLVSVPVVIVSYEQSEARIQDVFGVLKLTLGPTAYEWEFIPIAYQSGRDTGNQACH